METRRAGRPRGREFGRLAGALEPSRASNVPVADVDPLAEFVADLFEVGYGAEAEFLKERHARVVGQGDAAHGAMKTAAAQLDEDRIEQR